MHREAWWATVHRVKKSRTWLSDETITTGPKTAARDTDPLTGKKVKKEPPPPTCSAEATHQGNQRVFRARHLWPRVEQGQQGLYKHKKDTAKRKSQRQLSLGELKVVLHSFLFFYLVLIHTSLTMNTVTQVKSSKFAEFSIFCWSQKDCNKESKVLHKILFFPL